jgi:hypothetical protein
MSSDFRNIGKPLYCEHCGSSMYDKEWGLVHSEGCHFNVKNQYEPELKPEQKETKPLNSNGISNEIAEDLARFHGINAETIKEDFLTSPLSQVLSAIKSPPIFWGKVNEETKQRILKNKKHVLFLVEKYKITAADLIEATYKEIK